MIPLYEHQKRAIKFLENNNFSGALIHEPGLGKTRTVIETIKLVREKDPYIKVLVVAPLSILDAAWAQDIKKFSDFTCCNIHKKWNDEEILKADFILINYEMFRSKTKLAKFVKLTKAVDLMCVLDESSRLKAHNSQTTKLMLMMAPVFKHRIIMSGTPTPNTELEWWGQINFVKPYKLGQSFHRFKNRYFHLSRGAQVIQTQGQYFTAKELAERFRTGWKYDITPQSREALMEEVMPLCSVARKADCLDLPPMIDECRIVTMGSRQKKAYEELKKHLIAEIDGNPIVAQNILTKIMKLREITSGFCIGEDGKIATVECPKITELENIVNDSNEQMIVWINYKWEVHKVVEALMKYGNVGTLYGETKNKDEEIRRFIAGETRFLVAHPQSAAHGLTFTNCNLQVYFSLSYSYEQYEQSRARTHRAGQTRACTYIHLLCGGTIDEKIYEVVKRKQKTFESALDFIA